MSKSTSVTTMLRNRVKFYEEVFKSRPKQIWMSVKQRDQYENENIVKARLSKEAVNIVKFKEIPVFWQKDIKDSEIVLVIGENGGKKEEITKD